MTDKEALKLALDWLEGGNFVYPTELRTAIKEALALPVQPERNEAAIRADEREACAKIAETAEPYQSADLIRARGQA
jgi:hypothetical protein